MKQVIVLLLAGLSVGLGNFAASVAIGIGGVEKSLRWRIAVIFGLFETGMPIIGLFLGRQISGVLSGNANIVGGLLLGLTGLYIVYKALFVDEQPGKNKSVNTSHLIVTGLALSIDNLIVGFGLGSYSVNLFWAAVTIGFAGASLSLIGLELGRYLGFKAEAYSEILSGLTLLAVGLAIGFRIL